MSDNTSEEWTTLVKHQISECWDSYTHNYQKTSAQLFLLFLGRVDLWHSSLSETITMVEVLLIYAFASKLLVLKQIWYKVLVAYLVPILWRCGICLQGVPFRTSHDIVGRAVAMCVSKNCQLQDLSLGELQSINPVFDKEVYEFLGVENAVKKFSSYGSTGSECVASQLEYWTAKLDLNWKRKLWRLQNMRMSLS